MMILTTMNLFSQLECEPTHEELYPGAVLMRGLALPEDRKLLDGVETICKSVPFRQMTTPGGLLMSVVSTACGASNRLYENSGFRYGDESGANKTPRPPRPPMPEIFYAFAIRAATLAGFPRFRPDAGLVNRYQAGVKLGLHQDRHECDLTQPIVSVSLGLPATFLMGGLLRTDPARRILLEHGDVVVWGGPSRMRFHGVQPLKPGIHPLTGSYRFNLTFRKVG
jgi:alkylated DNA repair protein (DNA oxidative demethylase)